MEGRCEAAFIGIERGGNCSFNHLQGVIHREVNSLNQNAIETQAALWGKPPLACLHVLSKALTEIHTWHGMIGYYMKDKLRPRHRQYHTANITFEDMQVAEDAY